MEENVTVPDKRAINIIYVDGESSHLGHFRGKSALSHFETNWRRMSNVQTTYTSENAFVEMDIGSANVIWLDNVRSVGVAKKIEALKEREGENIRVIYALDELIWEGPAGRATTLNECRVVEMFIATVDCLVVSNNTIVQILTQMGLIDDTKEYIIIPTTVGYDFYPTYCEFRKRGLSDKNKPNATVLVKGVNIPENVQRFIESNYKVFNITIASVGKLSPRIMGEIESGNIKHIRHWANPDVTARTALAAFAMERDRRYDFTIITKPDDLSAEYYELTTGDEDILFAAAAGSVPIGGIGHVGYVEDSLYYASGLVFGSESTPADIAKIIKSTYKSSTQWNKHMHRVLGAMQDRVSGSPKMLRAYYTALVGVSIVEQETEIARKALEEAREKIKADEVAKESPISEEQSKIIKANFGGGENG